MAEFEVVQLGECEHPEVGEQAPDFVRPLVNEEYWEDASLSELFADAPVLLVFHPMDGAFPATYLWNELRDRGFAAYDLHVVGLSISTPYEHKRLIDERELAGTGVRLFADPANEIAQQYGIEHDLDGMAGISEPRPATFLIDEDGTVRYCWVAREWPEHPDYDEVEAVVTTLLE